MQQNILVAEFDGVIGVYVLDLQNGQEIHFAMDKGELIPVNPDVAFTSSSTVKIAIMVSYFIKYGSEALDENTSNLILDMIRKSENPPADRLMDALDSFRGPLVVTDDMKKIGLENTCLAGFFCSAEAPCPLLQRIDTPANQRVDVDALRILAAAASLACVAAFAATEAEIVDLAKRAANSEAAAKTELEKLAGEGDTLAEHFMGVLYVGGKGVSQSDWQAADWFLRAARKGHLDSMHNLAVIYERTTGTLKDTDAARAWYRQAAEKGFARSQARLGEMLLAGLGWTPDSEQARQWIEKSAAQNEPRGQYLLGMLKLEGRAGVERDPAEAARLQTGTAPQGGPGASRPRRTVHGSGGQHPGTAGGRQGGDHL